MNQDDCQTKEPNVIYGVVTGHDLYLFMAEVNERIAKGWELQGGVSASRDGMTLYFAQAITRKA